MASEKVKVYLIDNAQLMTEYDYDKNTHIDVSTITSGSHKKLWWRCSAGHSWLADVSKRFIGNNCPYCSGKKILPGFNDLLTTHPLLIQEWDYEKNTVILPSEVSKGSEDKVWWKCKHNHSWKSAVYSRTAGVGCPICSKELQSSYPEKALYYYIKKEFPDSISNYKSEALGAFELDIYIPSLHIGIEYDGERWHQDLEKDLQKNKKCAGLFISLIRVREPKCPILSDGLSQNIILKNKKNIISEIINAVFKEISKTTGVKYLTNIDIPRDHTEILALLNLSEKENNLLALYPDIAKEWDYEKNGKVSPNTVSIGSDKKVWWICPLEHSYSASISSRIRGRGCSICAGKTILRGFNDFKSHCPELAKDWDYTKNRVSPDTIAYGSDKKYWWICSRGHSYECSINNRRAGQACPYCSGKRVLSGFNDLCTTHPTVASQWCTELNTILPNEVNAGSHKRVWWECEKCGHRWLSYVYNRCLNNAGCPKCSGRIK